MEWARTWDWANAVVFDVETETLEFRSSTYGFLTQRQINPPAEECRTRFLCISDYWSTYR